MSTGLLRTRCIVRKPGYREAVYRELVKDARREVLTVEDLNMDAVPAVKIVDPPSTFSIEVIAGMCAGHGHMPTMLEQEKDFIDSIEEIIQTPNDDYGDNYRPLTRIFDRWGRSH